MYLGTRVQHSDCAAIASGTKAKRAGCPGDIRALERESADGLRAQRDRTDGADSLRAGALHFHHREATLGMSAMGGKRTFEETASSG
jgi:hypothetical protein